MCGVVVGRIRELEGERIGNIFYACDTDMSEPRPTTREKTRLIVKKKTNHGQHATRQRYCGSKYKMRDEEGQKQ